MIEHVIKRDGRVVPYSGECIKQAIFKAAASQAVEYAETTLSDFLKDIEAQFTETTVSVEDVQDKVEEYLMYRGQFVVARAYIVYREEHARMRALRQADDETRETRSQGPSRRSFSITNSEGLFEEFSVDTLRSFLLTLPESQAPEVDIEDIIDEVAKGAFEGMTTKDIARSLVLAARSRIERDPAYDALAAALQLAIVYREALGCDQTYDLFLDAYGDALEVTLLTGIAADRYADVLTTKFDLARIKNALRPERDKLFKYLGVQTLYDRYLIHIEGRRIETPQFFWMRVAMGLAINEDNPTERAIEFYEVLSKLLFTSATPTLFNSGTNHPQLSSCYLTTVDDDLENIFDCIKDNAMLSKWAGGLGNDWTNVRATNAHIKGTNGTSQGVIPFLKVVNDTAIAVNQCFAGDTRVETPNGLVPIRDIKEGDLVRNGDGEYRRVREAHEYDQHGPMVQITTADGGITQVTSGHPILVANHEKMVSDWVEAGDIKAGDYVVAAGDKFRVHKKVERVEAIEPITPVYDLLMDGPESYCTEHMIAHNGGKRKGAVCAYLEPWHLDFEEFLDLRKNTGDDRRRTHDMHTAAWIPDLFMQRVEANGQWTLFSPDEVPELHDLYGKAFKAKYEEYERMADEGKMRQFQRIRAVDLWRKMLTRIFETGHCWQTYKDPSNIRSPQDHVGVVHSSNLCCVDGDELVPVEGRGLVRARTLYEEGKEIRLLGKDAVHSCPMYMPVEMGKRVRIHTKEGYTHTVTPDHKVALVDGSQVMAKDLKEGDKLALQTLRCEGSLLDPLYAFASGVHVWGEIDEDVVLRYRMPWHTRIPNEVLQGNYDTIIAYCEGLRVGAAASLGEQCPKNVTCCHTESIARDLQVLLLQIGIQTRLYVEKIGIYDTVWMLQSVRTDRAATFSHLEELPDAPAYCPTVPTEDHLWTCNGFLTRNTEILLNTSKDETAVCNLGSLNLGRFIEDGAINADLLGDTIVTAVRMLDNVIDINYYPTPEARNSNLKHRPIGLGLMGFQDALHKMGISYASDRAVEFADEVMEGISAVAISASSMLAKERGTYPSYEGSKWDRGLFPIDTVKLVEQERGEPVLMGADQNEESLAMWYDAKAFVAEHGMRNSNVMAIAPTATISTIVGASQSIEPTYKFIYAKSNLSGDFTQVDEHLVKHLKEKGLWTPEILDELKYHDGCLADMPSIPQETKDLFKTAFEIDPEWLIKAASARQRWIDQGQSLNLYLREPSGKKIDEMYRFAWRAGLKTTYYLRTQAATTVEKSTVDINKHGIQPKWMKSKSASDGIQVDRGAPKQCSLDNPDCEACQ